ncbi:MAG: hypothetical protein IIX01_01715, partial [Clostridia bacterium]|nr:hypothetical protein [Clostridia bacterium]
KQKICTTLDEDTLITHLISDDTYYARTQKRDAEYNVIFGERGKEIDGKRKMGNLLVGGQAYVYTDARRIVDFGYFVRTDDAFNG